MKEEKKNLRQVQYLQKSNQQNEQDEKNKLTFESVEKLSVCVGKRVQLHAGDRARRAGDIAGTSHSV